MWNARRVAERRPALTRPADPGDGIDVLRRGIDQNVASARCPGGDDDCLDRLLREPTEVVRGRSKEGQLLEGPELGRKPTLVLCRLGQTLAHPDVGVRDRDDPADGLHVALVDFGGLVRTREEAQERAQDAVAFADGEDRLRGDPAFGDRPEIRIERSDIGQSFAECPAARLREESFPEAE